MKYLMLVLMLLALPAHGETIKGSFALAGKPPAIEGLLEATPQKNGEALDFVFTKPDQAVPLKAYDTELTKQLHVIAIGSDFNVFMHDHVAHVSKDGHFRLVMKLPQGLYHIYADTAPAGFGQQVVRFDVQVGSLCKAEEPVLEPSGLSANSGEYTVQFDSLEATAGQPAMATLHILKDGQPALDIKPFLGVPAHAVFIDTADLSYLHAHPMDMKNDTPPGLAKGMANPNLMLHFRPEKAGIYKLWVQFNGGGKLQTVPFVFTVK